MQSVDRMQKVKSCLNKLTSVTLTVNVSNSQQLIFSSINCFCEVSAELQVKGLQGVFMPLGTSKPITLWNTVFLINRGTQLIRQ